MKNRGEPVKGDRTARIIQKGSYENHDLKSEDIDWPDKIRGGQFSPVVKPGSSAAAEKITLTDKLAKTFLYNST